MKPGKVYLGTTKGYFKQRFCNHKKPFNNSIYRNHTTLSKYVWDIKEKFSKTTVLKWCIARTVPSYFNITKRCLLCLHKKSEILYYPNTDQLLNKRSERALPSSFLMKKFSVSPIFADFREMHLTIRRETRLRGITSPIDFMEELVF